MTSDLFNNFLLVELETCEFIYFINCMLSLYNKLTSKIFLFNFYSILKYYIFPIVWYIEESCILHDFNF
jgi:hypothetical protein